MGFTRLSLVSSSAFCGTDPDGFGPTSPTRNDLTFCFENSILLAIPAVIAMFTFLFRIYYLKRHTPPQDFKRTWSIYILSQILLLATSGALIGRAIQLGSASGRLSYSIASMLGTSFMAVAWFLAAVVNEFETRHNIRSGYFILGYQIFALIGSAVTIRTMHDINQIEEQQFTTFVIYFGLGFLAFFVQVWPRSSILKVQKMLGAS